MTRTAALRFREIPHGLFTLFFPASCRVCDEPLLKWTRVPVCSACLAAPQPLEAEYFCASCHTPFLNEHPLDAEGVCRLCRSGLRGFDRASSFGFYEGPLRSLVHLFKYSGMKPLARPLGALLNRAVSVDSSFDCVAAVPLHWRKQRERGFNQSELLAAEVARLRGLPLVRALRRKRATAVQAGLAMAGRRRNVAGAFEARRGEAIRGKKVLLVDDVMTTGATASICAQVLKRAGAKSVSLVTLARVDRRWTP